MEPDEEHSIQDDNNDNGDESDFENAELRTDSSGDWGTQSRNRDSSYKLSVTDINAKADYGLSQNEDSQSSDSVSPRKRRAKAASAFRPFKRRKGSLNAEYLDLLNRDIDDAAYRVCLDEEVQFSNSQIGLTKWSSIEKRQFFEATSRLGKYDLPGIAARIGTKSEVEVHQYINLLRDSIEERNSRKSKNRRSYLEFAQYPAAVELSQQCCYAQEEAADAISVRQERREEQREEHKWGPNWDITLFLAKKLSRELEKGEPTADAALKFARLFRLPIWLSLSERIFMNSSVAGSNWNYVDEKQPSMWATAFDDFYSLAVSITRRLVQSTLFISLSRIRAKRELHPTTRNLVRKKDVEAAVASLNMLQNARDLWRTSARRLRLDVFEEPPDRDDDSGVEEEPMTYDEIEARLSFEPEASEEQGSSQEGRRLWVPSDDSIDPTEDSEGLYDAAADLEVGKQRDIEDEDECETKRELREILWYSSADIRDVRSAKQALRLRIETERLQEAQAQTHDDYASYQAERDMWAILQKKPPMELPRVQEPEPVQRSNLELDSIYPLGKNWASSLEYYEEWETLHATHDEDEDEF